MTDVMFGPGLWLCHKGVHGMTWEKVEQWERAWGSFTDKGFNADEHGLA